MTTVKRYVTANAKKLSDIGDDLEGETLPLLEALAQLYLFPNTEYENHWREEVWSKISEVSRTKRSHKLPKSSYILNNTWNLYKTRVRAIMNRAVAHEHKLVPNVTRRKDVDTFYGICEEYMTWLALKLSTEGVIDPEDVYNKLDELKL